MRAQILLNILLFYGILIVINIPAGFLGLEFEANEKPRVWYEPPGYVIPIVWFVLFTAMGYAHYLIQSSENAKLSWWIIGLAIMCAGYAYYTLGLEN